MATADDPRPSNLPEQYTAAWSLMHAAQAGSPIQPRDRLSALGDALQRLVQVYLEGEEAAGEDLQTSLGAAALFAGQLAGKLIGMTDADRQMALILLGVKEMAHAARTGEKGIDARSLLAADVAQAVLN